MKKASIVKLWSIAGFAGLLGAGCASSGFALFDDKDADEAMGSAASSESRYALSERTAPEGEVVEQRGWVHRFPYDGFPFYEWEVRDMERMEANSETAFGRAASSESGGESSEEFIPTAAPESSLSMGPETRARWVNTFPFYDWDLRTIEVRPFNAGSAMGASPSAEKGSGSAETPGPDCSETLGDLK